MFGRLRGEYRYMRNEAIDKCIDRLQDDIEDAIENLITVECVRLSPIYSSVTNTRSERHTWKRAMPERAY